MFGTTFLNCNVISKLCRSLVSGKLSNRRNVSGRAPPNDSNSKVLPRLVYLHNPWAYIQTKWQFFKLRLMWDREFLHDEFIRGTKQSAVVVTDIIRDQDGIEIGNFTTPVGFQQITRDMILSRNDTRLKLVNFRVEDIHRAIPMKVNLIKRAGRKNCLVDMVFVIMRNSKDFADPKQKQLIQSTLRQLDQKMRTGARVINVPHRILFAEIYMRFYRDYAPNVLDDWAVAFYKIISFDILNYDPQ